MEGKGRLTYDRGFPSSSSLAESDNSEVNRCHMPESPLPNPRKRLRSEQRLPQELPLKTQKLNYPEASQPPAAFWDNLSKIWLTERALEELDRRTTQTVRGSCHLSRPQPRPPATESVVAKWKNKVENWEPTRSAVDLLDHYSSEQLSDIHQLARDGGVNLLDLRGYRNPLNSVYNAMSSSYSSSKGQKRKSSSNTKPTATTTTTRNIRPYDRDFQQNLIDGSVFPYHYEYPDGRVPAEPENWEEIIERLAQPRSSLSPSRFSDEEYAKFRRADAYASKEKQVMESVIPIIEGDARNAGYVAGGIPFTNLAHLTDGTLVPGNPDRYYGARPEQINRQVRTLLSDSIIPSTQNDLPAAPNFFLAGKGPDGSIAVAGRQASYDGALGARGIQSLKSYWQDEPVYDNHAHTITSIYHCGTLKIYTSHPVQPSGPEGRPEYHMTQLKTYAMTSDSKAFRDGIRAFRNARDWAREQRDEAIRQANEKADVFFRTMPTNLVSSFTTEVSDIVATTSMNIDSSTARINASYTSETPHENSDTSTDELTKDIEPPAKRSKPAQFRHRKA